MDQRVVDLELQTEELAEELRYLRGELSRLRRLVVAHIGPYPGPGEGDSASAASSLRSLRSQGDSRLSVGRGSAVERPFNEDATRSRSQGSGPSESGVSSRTIGTSCSLTWGEREEICKGIGEWALRCLRGQHHGASGRDQISLANRVWVVFRDYEGLNYEPAGVCRTWTECHNLVKRGHDTGEAVFVGLPSLREAQTVCAAANIGWPADL